MDWLQRLDVWVAIFSLGALAWFELRLDRFVGPIVQSLVGSATEAAEDVKRRRRSPTTVRLKSRPIRGDAGRFDGSLPAVPVVPESRSGGETRSDDRSALGSQVPGDNEVPIGTIPFDDAVLIALRLGRGMSPSAVAKSLPGYSARKYKDYMEKVSKIEEILAELEPVEQTQEQS